MNTTEVTPVDGAPLRVMLLCDWFLKYTASFAAGLVRTGNEVCLVCRDHAHEFGHDTSERAATIERARASGVGIIEFPGRMSSSHAAAIRALRAARSWQADIAHVQSATFDPRLFFALRRRQPLVMTVHDPVPHQGHRLRRRNQLIERAWRRRADCLVVHSPQLITALGHVRQRVAVLPHGAEVLATPLPRPGTPAVLLFGRLEPYKGVRVLTEAMEYVWRTRPDVRLLVCGKGPATGDLPDDPRVEARLEYIPEADVDPLFAKASLVVLPYTDASQSGVGTMAIARGIPAIVSEIGGLTDLVIDDPFSVPPGDSSALADAIVRHVDHGDGVRIEVLRLANERLGWDSVGLAAADLYRGVLRSRLP